METSKVLAYKITYVFIMIFIFSVIYTFFDNEEFAGWIELSNNRLPYSVYYKVRREVFAKYASKYKDFMDKEEFLSIPIIKANNAFHIIHLSEAHSSANNKSNLAIKELLFDIYAQNNKITFDIFTEIPFKYDLYTYEESKLDNAILYSNKYAVLDYFDRLYYSSIVQTTIGFGDIFPATRKLRFFTMIQALSTLLIIIL